jgi:hypothetical protein
MSNDEKQFNIVKTRTWLFTLNAVVDDFRSVLQSAQAQEIGSRIKTLHSIFFAFKFHGLDTCAATDTIANVVEISGFIHAHDQIRGSTIKSWLRDDRIVTFNLALWPCHANSPNWTPCLGESGIHWTEHDRIRNILSESSSDGRNREFWRWDAESSKLVPCDGMPTVSKGGRPSKKYQTSGESIDFPKKRKRTDGLASTQGFSVSDKKAANVLKKLPLVELQALLRAENCPIREPGGYDVPITKQECVADIISTVGSQAILRGAANAAAAIAAATTAAIIAAAAAAKAHPATTNGEESPACRRRAHTAIELEIATPPCMPHCPPRLTLQPPAASGGGAETEAPSSMELPRCGGGSWSRQA